MKGTPEERFWAKVKKTSGCWNWTGGKNSDGYGLIYVKDKLIYAHRFSYELHIGKIPPDMFICHHCDNSFCVRPDHLFLGTNSDNMADMKRKGRGNEGEKNGRSKLTKAQIYNIFHDRENGMSQQAIADKRGVSQQLISSILREKLWTRFHSVKKVNAHDLPRR